MHGKVCASLTMPTTITVPESEGNQTSSPKPLRIVIVRTSCRGVVAESGFYNSQEIGLARALSKRGHHVDIVLFGGKESRTSTVNYDFDGVQASSTIYYVPGLALYDAGLFKGLDDLVGGYDIIQPAEYDQVETWLLAKKFAGKVIVYHGPYYSDFNKRYNLKCRVADTVFAPRYRKLGTPFITKSTLAEDFLRHKGIKNVETIGVGLDTAQLIPERAGQKNKLAREIAREKSEGIRHLLYVGKIEPRRNSFLLLDVMERLANHDDIKLIVVGSGEADYLREWEASINKRELENSVQYVGRIPQAELPSIYSGCDLFLLPTSFEIFGMVLLEAMYYGVAPVTTVNGGSSVLLTGGLSKLVVDSLDASEWASRIENLLSDPAGLKALAKEARTRILEGFTWDALAPRFEQQYLNMVENKTRQ
jgi:glycosyltransferase involved in cell wall biosynthesis